MFPARAMSEASFEGYNVNAKVVLSNVKSSASGIVSSAGERAKLCGKLQTL